LERVIAHEADRVGRELHLIRKTTEQLAAMTVRDGNLLLTYNDRATDFLYRMGSTTSLPRT
jgi:hypothetical protein